MSEQDDLLTPEVLEGIYYIISELCSKENNYTYITRTGINGLQYKIRVRLMEVDEILDAKQTIIEIRRISPQ